jgi:hypothetical protein
VSEQLYIAGQGYNSSGILNFNSLTRFRFVVQTPRAAGDNAMGTAYDVGNGDVVGFGLGFVKNLAIVPSSFVYFRGLYFWFDFIQGTKWNVSAASADVFSIPDPAVTTITDTGADVTGNTWYVLEGVNTAGTWEFFVDGVSVGTISTNLPTGESVGPNITNSASTNEVNSDRITYRTQTVNALPGLSDW